MRTSQLVLIASGLLVLSGCGGSSTSTRGSGPEIDETGGAAGSEIVEPQTGGSEQTGGGSGETGGTGGSVEPPSGGTDAGGSVSTTGGAGSGGRPETGGGAGEATGGTGNVGGNCEPWDCTNIAIDLAGWDSASGDPVPEACGLVEDPCTGMMVDCGGCTTPNTACGEGFYSTEPETPPEPGTPGLCGGGCVVLGFTGGCDTQWGWGQNYSCNTSDNPEAPDTLCEDLGGGAWCCYQV